MDRTRLQDHLAQAERHVREGEERISRQVGLITRLEQHGHDTLDAKRLLEQLNQIIVSHRADRDRLKAELAAVR